MAQILKLISKAWSLILTMKIDREHLRIGLLGKFNASNLLAVVATLLAGGIGCQMQSGHFRMYNPFQDEWKNMGAVISPVVIVIMRILPMRWRKMLGTLRELCAPRIKARKRPCRMFICIVSWVVGLTRTKGSAR